MNAPRTPRPDAPARPDEAERSSNPLSLEALVERVCSGDREAGALLLQQHGGLIRARYRRQLSRAMRRVVDSQELIATISRRFDRLLAQGDLLAESPRQVWALIFRIGDNAVIDKARVLRRLQRAEGPDSQAAELARLRLARAEQADPAGFELELDAMLSALPDAVDREIFTLWLMGQDRSSIAAELGVSAEAIRKRWQRIRERLALTLHRGEADDPD